MSVSPIPEGYSSVTPYLVCRGAADLLQFVQRAFAAKQVLRMDGPGGAVLHAEVRIGNSLIMLGEAHEGVDPMPTTLHLYVEDCDAVYRSAVDAGATSVSPPTNQIYGDRSAAVTDAHGNRWWIATHVEDVSAEEVRRRMAAMQT